MSPAAPRASLVRPLMLVVLVLVAYALVGVVSGIVWERVWTPPAEIVQQHNPYYLDYGSLRRVFTGTGLYVLVGGAASAVVALGVSLLTRRRELFTLLAVVLGSTIAALLMWKVGVRARAGGPEGGRGHGRRRHPALGQPRGERTQPLPDLADDLALRTRPGVLRLAGGNSVDPEPPPADPQPAEAEVSEAPHG